MKRGYCEMHYQRLRIKGDVGGLDALREHLPNLPNCRVPGCSKVKQARGMCQMHYKRWQQTGDPGPAESTRPQVTTRIARAAVGERRINDQGYVIVRLERGDPMAHSKGWGLEHRVVMSKIIGRPLRPTEEVHHKNGIRHDNRPENLELWLRSQPPGARVADLVEWARSIERQYGHLV